MAENIKNKNDKKKNVRIGRNVKKGDREKSKTEFDNAYFRVHDDAVNLIKLNFGAKKEIVDENSGYIGVTSNKILKDVMDIGTYIRIANSIYPATKAEYGARRSCQGKAIGLCFDLLTKYQLVMKHLKVPDDKFVEETGNIAHEINALKKWRTSDNKRFKDLP